MADTKALKEFRRALADAHRLADFASTAAWRARKRADDLREQEVQLSPTISSEKLRLAIAQEVNEIHGAAMQAEDASYARRARLLELLELLGGRA